MVDYRVMEKQGDELQVSGLCERIKKHYPDEKIKSHSFDKSFLRQRQSYNTSGSGIEQVILPKKGRHKKEDKGRG